MRLSELNAKSKSTTVDFDGEELHVSYRPHYLTSKVEEELADIESAEGSRVKRIITMMCRLVSAWDMVDEVNSPLPLNPDTLADAGLTADVASAIVNKVLEDGTSVGEENSNS